MLSPESLLNAFEVALFLVQLTHFTQSTLSVSFWCIFCPLCLHFLLPTFVWDLLLSAHVQPRSVPQCPCPFFIWKLRHSQARLQLRRENGAAEPWVPRDLNGEQRQAVRSAGWEGQPGSSLTGWGWTLRGCRRGRPPPCCSRPLGIWQWDNPVGHRVAVTWGAGPCTIKGRQAVPQPGSSRQPSPSLPVRIQLFNSYVCLQGLFIL